MKSSNEESNLSMAQPTVAATAMVQSKLLSDEIFLKAIYINVIIANTVTIFGISANLLNIVIFLRQGFKDTINVSLTSLALVDLASLLCLLWMSVCYNPSFHDLVAPSFDSIQIAYLFGAIPRSHCMLMGSWITAVIAGERCACVIRPLEVKFILTRSRLVVVLIAVFVLSLVPTAPLYYSTRLYVFHDPFLNSTRVGVFFTQDRKEIDLQFSGISVTIFVSAFVVIAVSSVVIVWTLVSQSRWRAASMGSQPQAIADPREPHEPQEEPPEIQQQPSLKSQEKKMPQKAKSSALSPRDRKAAMTVSLIAAMFVVCYFPGILNLLGQAFVPGFAPGGRYGNAYQFFWSVSHTLEAVCSSSNIFVYIQTSTNFKTTLKTLFK